VRKDGVVVTNLHVISQDNSSALYSEVFFTLPETGMEAELAARRYRLKPVLIKREYDLALLRVAGAFDGQPLPPSDVLPAIEVGDSRAIQLLDKLIIIGFPQGGGTSVTVNEGVVEGKDVVGQWIKTSARLIHGNSGGAAVDREGRLVGIPTKVVVDKSLVRKGSGPTLSGADYDGAAVGFLRPAQLVQSMLASVKTGAMNSEVDPSPTTQPGPPQSSHQTLPQDSAQATIPATIMVRGLVRAAGDHRPIAGARVGLLPLGASDVTTGNLIAWGGTNAEGEFALNKPAARGRYTIKVRALGYQDFVGDFDIGEGAIVIELGRRR
jgi:S1-C subfamily serine protease